MRHAGNFNPEWGYLAPAPSFLRSVRLVVVAAAIGATASAAVVFSLADRPAAEETVAARTLVRSSGVQSTGAAPTAGSVPVAAQLQTQLQTQSEHVSASSEVQPASVSGAIRRQGAPPVAHAGAPPSAGSESGVASTAQRSPIAAMLAEAPIMSEVPPAHAANETAAAAVPEAAPPQKAPSKKSRLTARAAPRYGQPRYGAPRYEPRYDSMQRGSFAYLRQFGGYGGQEY